jgi:hypothetical protein
LHQGNTISTPAIEGTILPGITRKSIIEVAESKGYKVDCSSFSWVPVFRGIEEEILKLCILVEEASCSLL